MRTTPTKTLLLAAPFAGLLSVFCVDASAAWQDETVLVSKQGDQAVVRKMNDDKVLFQSKDGEAAMVWAMANGRTTVVLAGKYFLSKSVVPPRDGVTLILTEESDLEMSPDSKQTEAMGFRGRGKVAQQILPLIHVRNRNNVRVICLGTLRWSKFEASETRPMFCQTFPVTFDGRSKGGLGVKGGMLVGTGDPSTGYWLVDCQGVEVPLLSVQLETKAIDALLAMEGCDDIRIGMIANLSPRNPPETAGTVDRRMWPFPTPPPSNRGRTGEAFDANSSNSGIVLDRLVGQKGHELIDGNGSTVEVKELISIDQPSKFVCYCVNSGARLTDRSRGPERLDIWKATMYPYVTDVKYTVDVPKLPEALPKFDITANIEMTLGDGAKQTISHTVPIDIEKELKYEPQAKK